MKLTFDYDEFFNEKLESTAILMWSTHYQTFTLAFYLNQLYGLGLERLDNITVEQKTGHLHRLHLPQRRRPDLLLPHRQPTAGRGAKHLRQDSPHHRP